MAEIITNNDEVTEILAAVKGKIVDIKNVDSRLDTLNKNIVTPDPI